MNLWGHSQVTIVSRWKSGRLEEMRIKYKARCSYSCPFHHPEHKNFPLSAARISVVSANLTDSVVTVSRRVCMISQTPSLSSLIYPVRSMSNRFWHDGSTRDMLSKVICAFCLFPSCHLTYNSPLGITCPS